jgi:hypothetical protein
MHSRARLPTRMQLSLDKRSNVLDRNVRLIAKRIDSPLNLIQQRLPYSLVERLGLLRLRWRS